MLDAYVGCTCSMIKVFCMQHAGLVAYADLDERAIDALREFNEEGALSVLQQFKESDLSHVQVSLSVVIFLPIAFMRSFFLLSFVSLLL